VACWLRVDGAWGSLALYVGYRQLHVAHGVELYVDHRRLHIILSINGFMGLLALYVGYRQLHVTHGVELYVDHRRLHIDCSLFSLLMGSWGFWHCILAIVNFMLCMTIVNCTSFSPLSYSLLRCFHQPTSRTRVAPASPPAEASLAGAHKQQTNFPPPVAASSEGANVGILEFPLPVVVGFGVR